MKVHGDVTLVATKDIGSLGPAEGKPVTYRWNRVWSVLGLVAYGVAPAFVLFMVWLSHRRRAPMRGVPGRNPATREVVR